MVGMDEGTNDCPHVNFEVNATVNRLTRKDAEEGTIEPAVGFMADIRVDCIDCGEPFYWIGLPVGVMTGFDGEPTTSFDRTELRAPIFPVSGLNDDLLPKDKTA